MTTTRSGPTRWPRLREVWWIAVLAAVALGLFVVGLLVRLRCSMGPCPARYSLLDLDSFGSLPRLFTTGLFLLVAVLAAVAAARTSGRQRLFWAVVAGLGVVLAVAKLTSIHSLAEGSDGATVTLLVGSLVTVLGLLTVWAVGRRADVPGTRVVVAALAAYALAALGLDAVTRLVLDAQAQVGPYSTSGAVFVEEFGEALTALALLVTVRWQMPPGSRSHIVAG